MNRPFSFALVMICLLLMTPFNVIAYENEEIINKSQIITNKYAENFCNAKADNFFKGLDNEKILKDSYFKHIGLQSKETLSEDHYNSLINSINRMCIINDEEKREIKEILFN